MLPLISSPDHHSSLYLEYTHHYGSLYLEYTQHPVQLVFSEYDVPTDLRQTVNGIQSHFVNLIIKHVNEEILGECGKHGRLCGELAQRVNSCVTYLCMEKSHIIMYINTG